MTNWLKVFKSVFYLSLLYISYCILNAQTFLMGSIPLGDKTMRRSLFFISATFIFIVSLTFAYLFFSPKTTELCINDTLFNQDTEEVYRTQPCLDTASAKPITWFKWLQGKSRSAQFHFFDFTELLFAKNKKPKA